MANHTIDSERQEVENNVAVCKRLLAKGGYLLIVGGEMSNLRLQDNPQLIVWDDNKQGALQKSIPSNTRGIVYSRWVSHAMAGRLREAAKKLAIPLFPMQKTREVRALVIELLHEDAVPTAPEAPVIIDEPQPLPSVVEQFVPTEATDTNTIGEDMALRKPLKNEMLSIIHKHRDHFTTDLGSRLQAEKFVPILKREYGIGMTRPAVEQALYKYKNHMSEGLPIPEPGQNVSSAGKSARPTKGKARAASSGKSQGIDFQALEEMLNDALAGIKLALEAIPQLKAEVEQVRQKQAQLRALLE